MPNVKLGFKGLDVFNDKLTCLLNKMWNTKP